MIITLFPKKIRREEDVLLISDNNHYINMVLQRVESVLPVTVKRYVNAYSIRIDFTTYQLDDISNIIELISQAVQDTFDIELNPQENLDMHYFKIFNNGNNGILLFKDIQPLKDVIQNIKTIKSSIESTSTLIKTKLNTLEN